jgi:hypothetical protein
VKRHPVFNVELLKKYKGRYTPQGNPEQVTPWPRKTKEFLKQVEDVIMHRRDPKTNKTLFLVVYANQDLPSWHFKETLVDHDGEIHSALKVYISRKNWQPLPTDL